MSTLKTMYPGQASSPFTTTLGEISTTDTAVVVADASVLPSTVPYLLTLGYDKSASETVLVTAANGNTLTIERAVDGHALLWIAGTKAARIFTAKDLNDIQDNIQTLNTDKQEKLTFDTTPTSGSTKPVTSGGVHTALAKKQDTLTFDSAPTSGSTKPVTSGGVYTALAGKQNTLSFDTTPASGSTKPVTSGGVYTALAGKQAKLTFDSTPTQGSTNPVTSGGVQSALAGINTALAGKQDALTFDTTPMQNSTKPVTSGGVHTALDGKQDKLTFDASPTQNSTKPVTSGGVYTALAGKQNTLSFDSTPTSGSTKPVTSGGVYTALTGKQAKLTFDSAPTQGSTNPVTSGGVQSALAVINTALAGKQAALSFDTTPTQNSVNPVTSGGVHSALSAKANAASLASHTGSTSNPHKVTAAQIGAATTAQINAVIDEISAIGDIRTTVATLSSKWLPCDGRGVYSTDYPTLVPLLQTVNPMQNRKTIRSKVFTGNQYMYGKGAAYYNGTWVFVGCGYNTSSSKTLNIPVVYAANDLNGEWTEIRLSTGSFYLAGILYNSYWGKWVAYGYQYVSDTECYPYIFHAADPFGEWTGYKVSSTSCIIVGGAYASNKLVLIGRGCGSANSGYSYAYSAGYSVFFTQNNFSTNSAAPKAVREGSLAYGNGYWAFADNNQTIWYTDTPTGTWKSNTIISTGVQLRGLCYGGGTWCACGMQNSGGSGRAFYSTDITGSFKDCGVLESGGGNEYIDFRDGVFVMIPTHLSSVYSIYISADYCKTWTRKAITSGTLKALAAGDNGKWLAVSLYNSIDIFCHPEADAVLPKLPVDGAVNYIKAL